MVKSTTYTKDNGSGINWKVGAAAVLPRENVVFLGSSRFYTVYAAELAGILLALHIAFAQTGTE